MPSTPDMIRDSQPPRRGLHGWLEKLGLRRPELRAWAMYDWANSAMVTTIITAIFPIYYASVACNGVFSPDEARRRYARPRDRHGHHRRCSRPCWEPSPT